MAKVRIFEWAKENNRRSNEVVKKLQAEGYKIRNHTDLVDDGILKELVKVKKEEVTKPEIKETNVESKKEPTTKAPTSVNLNIHHVKVIIKVKILRNLEVISTVLILNPVQNL